MGTPTSVWLHSNHVTLAAFRCLSCSAVCRLPPHCLSLAFALLLFAKTLPFACVFTRNDVNYPVLSLPFFMQCRLPFHCLSLVLSLPLFAKTFPTLRFHKQCRHCTHWWTAWMIFAGRVADGGAALRSQSTTTPTTRSRPGPEHRMRTTCTSAALRTSTKAVRRQRCSASPPRPHAPGPSAPNSIGRCS